MPKCQLICPKCGLYFADVKFEYGGSVRARDVKILAGKRQKLSDGDVLACSSDACGYNYTNHDIMLAIATDPIKIKPGEYLVKPTPVLDENGKPMPTAIKEERV